MTFSAAPAINSDNVLAGRLRRTICCDKVDGFRQERYHLRPEEYGQLTLLLLIRMTWRVIMAIRGTRALA